MANRPPKVEDLNWSPERARELGQAALDIWVELLEKLPSLPVARPLNVQQVRDGLTFPVPEEPMSNDELVAYMRKVVFEYSTYLGHPMAQALVTGAGTVPGAIADFLASGLNQNAGGWIIAPSATEIELYIGRWLAGEFGLPDSAGGLFVSGGSMANWIGLKLARDIKGGESVQNSGLFGAKPMAVYASTEVHGVSLRAVDALGLGKESLRWVPATSSHQFDVELLDKMIAEDLDKGVLPMCIIANAGTVETGAVDPIDELADVAKKRDTWLHVDACYGGPAHLSEKLRPLFKGIERADSIAFDFHKWMYTPHPGGFVLARDFNNFGVAFSFDAPYTYDDKERTGHGLDMAFMSPQFSRPFMGFKVWLSLLAHGRKAYVRRIEHDVELTHYMAEKVDEHPSFERGADVTLSICCFRYVPKDLPEKEGRDEYLSELNKRVETAVEADGRGFCSNAVINGVFYLRTCIVNYRTEAEHMEQLLEVCAEHGAKLDAELRPDSLR